MNDDDTKKFCQAAIELKNNLEAAADWTRRAEQEEFQAAGSRNLARVCKERAEQAKATLRELLLTDELFPTATAAMPAVAELLGIEPQPEPSAPIVDADAGTDNDLPF